ncbi:PD40 domain-containing protein [candidate division KSB1 bacterium]|nr:PD40 domain-containing protein [candidate division KSB1 bacterium]
MSSTLSHFDLHAKSKLFAVLSWDWDSTERIEIRSTTKKLIAEIPSWYLPIHIRWSPDGSQLAFGSNDGCLYLYNLEDGKIHLIYKDSRLQAGFVEWSPDGQQLVYSARDRETLIPPDIYCIDPITKRTTQLTDNAKEVDRYPQWSPSGEYVVFHRQHLNEPERPMWIYFVNVK